MEEAEEPLLDTACEAAAILKVSERTIWNLVQRGHARTVKIMGATRLIHADILRIATHGTNNS
jgi:excisionase family DNA binding protein